MYGGVGGGEPRGSSLSRFGGIEIVEDEIKLRELRGEIFEKVCFVGAGPQNA